MLVYLSETEVKAALDLIAENFPGSQIAFDTAGSWIIANQHRHDAMRRCRS